MQTDVFVPEIDDLEISTSFVSYRGGEPDMVNVHYVSEKGDLAENFQTEEQVANYEERWTLNCFMVSMKVQKSSC
ncbi:hypothetical protein ACM26V_20485 [Salipaludibacillus sp. HK11]|uniref:hypothetical protein n=1 Tax=Salipaludibacillus sp. HK11 TaxID=3394320 RepID=UPI0039FD36B6